MRNPFRGALRRSFLERSQRTIGVLGLTALLGGSAFALLLSSGVFARVYHVQAHFADAAGIVPGDEVTVAGLQAGTVKGLQIENGQVVMDLAVNRNVELPADSRAEVVVQTLLGKETVSLEAGQASGLLQDGSVIPLGRTTTPINITELNDISVNLLQKSDPGALNDFLKEVTTITAGKGDQIHQIVSGLADVAQAVDERRTQLASLIDALRTISTTLGERDQTIVSLIDNLDPVLSDLAARENDIRTLLVATDSASHQTADLVARNRTVLDQTLTALHTDLGVIDQHQLDLAAAISYLDQAVQGYSSVGYSSGTANHWANIFVQSLGPAGVDALIGQCGVVDQLIDQALGVNCNFGPNAGQGGGGTGGGGRGNGGQGTGSGSGTGGGPLPTPSLPFPLPSPGIGSGHSLPALPGGLPDLVQWWLQGPVHP